MYSSICRPICNEPILNLTCNYNNNLTIRGQKCMENNNKFWHYDGRIIFNKREEYICYLCLFLYLRYYIRNRFSDVSSYACIYLTTNWNHKRNERRENVKRIYKWEYYIIIYNVLCLFCKNEPPVLGPEVCYILNRSTKYFFR